MIELGKFCDAFLYSYDHKVPVVFHCWNYMRNSESAANRSDSRIIEVMDIVMIVKFDEKY